MSERNNDVQAARPIVPILFPLSISFEDVHDDFGFSLAD